MLRKDNHNTLRSPASRTPQRGRSVPPHRQWGRLWLVGGLAAGVLILGVVISVIRSASGASGDIAGVQTFANIRAGHQDGSITYAQTPPVGGPHNAVWQNCGIYNQPLANEHGVHSLEHGAVWITYRPDLPAEAVNQLKTTLRGRTYTLLSPYPNLPSSIVASAWGVQLTLDRADDPRLVQFIRTYVQGPQTPEPGAACTGGLSTANGGQ